MVTAHVSSRDRSRPVLRIQQRDQLENNHREDWTTDTARRNGLLYSVRPFGADSLKKRAM
jgi:hypothetical protein